MTKYELRTKRMERKLNKLKEIINPLKEKTKTSHHKILTTDLKFTSVSGKTRGFRNVKELNKFINKQQKLIDARKLRAREKRIAKKQRQQNRESLKKLEKEIKLMEVKSNKIKGKRKEKLQREINKYKEAIAQYKRIKKEKPKTADLPASIKGIKRTVVKVASREKTVNFADRVWGLWEIAFSNNMEMIEYREALYNLAQAGELTDEEINKIGEFFDELYELLHSEDTELYESKKFAIQDEIENIFREHGINIPEKPF